MRSLPPRAVWRRRGACALIIAALGVFGSSRAAQAATKPCDAAPYHQLDFWLGDWRVYDGDTHRLVATDHIEKRLSGCVVEQRLDFVTDMYRRPGVSERLSGTSTSRFDGQQWLQLWVDNQWGAIIMSGAVAPNGDMVFNTIVPSRGRRVRLVWKKQPGGVVRILQYVAPAGGSPGASAVKWAPYGDLVYLPNPAKTDGGPRQTPQASSGPSTP